MERGDLGSVLKAARGLRRASQRELADTAHLSRGRYGDIEAGWILPTRDELERLAIALDVEALHAIVRAARRAGVKAALAALPPPMITLTESTAPPPPGEGVLYS